MPSLTVGMVLLLLVTFLLNIFVPFAKNVRIAKASGIPYVLVPYYGYNRLTSMFMARSLLRFTDKLSPKLRRSATSWRNLVTSIWPWKLGYMPFLELGTDTFLIVAPGGIILNTADADVISQITSRGDDFPKASHLYRHVDIFGKNVVSSAGVVWRRHRGITSPAFSEKNNQLVWRETLDITQTMLRSWLDPQPNGRAITVRNLGDDSMRLSLEVIGRAGLGQRIESPDVEQTTIAIPPGHTMTFTVAVQCLLANMLLVMALPIWILRKYPSKKFKKAYNAYVEWGLYMKEMLAAKRAAIQTGAAESSITDLISQLIKGQESARHSKSQPEIDFTEEDVIGNLFMFIIAGHETSANSIHFAILFLALHPEAQKSVQEEVESIFSGRSISAWNYEHDLPRLLNGYLAAVLNEQLRLISPTLTIPKVSSSQPQPLMVNGKSVTVPPNTMTRLCIPSVHRNPKYWPHGPATSPSEAMSAYIQDSDLEEFKPERWLKPTIGTGLYTPIKGSYIPFSEGQRACLGKRFAQVEILVALAVIFSSSSVELAVDDLASDEEVGKMSLEEKKFLWEKAKKRGHWTLRNKMTCLITMQLKGGHVPVRFVKKGNEVFRNI